jgi:hypothetical protein
VSSPHLLLDSKPAPAPELPARKSSWVAMGFTSRVAGFAEISCGYYAVHLGHPPRKASRPKGCPTNGTHTISGTRGTMGQAGQWRSLSLLSQNHGANRSCPVSAGRPGVQQSCPVASVVPYRCATVAPASNSSASSLLVLRSFSLHRDLKISTYSAPVLMQSLRISSSKIFRNTIVAVFARRYDNQ